MINYFEAILIMFGVGFLAGLCSGIISAHLVSKGIREDIRAEKAGDLGE